MYIYIYIYIHIMLYYIVIIIIVIIIIVILVVCMYMYVYIYMYVCVYIYIYIYKVRARCGTLAAVELSPKPLGSCRKAFPDLPSISPGEPNDPGNSGDFIFRVERSRRPWVGLSFGPPRNELGPSTCRADVAGPC